MKPLRLLFSALAMLLPGASLRAQESPASYLPPLKVENRLDHMVIHNLTNKVVAAVKLGTAHYVFRLGPLMQPGENMTVQQRLEDDNFVSGVAFEDGTIWGDDEVRSLHNLQLQMRDGGPVDTTNIQGYWYRVLTMYYRKAHPGSPDPLLLPLGDASTCPGGTCYYWIQLSWTTAAYVNNIPSGQWNIDTCTNQEAIAGAHAPAVLYAYGNAYCPVPSYYKRSTISVNANVTDLCPFGTPGASYTLNVLTLPEYGFNGLGGPCNQRWGVVAMSEISTGAGTLYGAMDDSCNYTSPHIVSPGGFGGCYN